MTREVEKPSHDGARGGGEERRELFGGRGSVEVWDLLGAQARQAAPFSAVIACRLSPLGSVGPHRQEADVELLVGLAGLGTALVDGEAFPLEPDRVVCLPLGAVLSIENTSTSPLEYLIIKARPERG